MSYADPVFIPAIAMAVLCVRACVEDSPREPVHLDVHCTASERIPEPAGPAQAFVCHSGVVYVQWIDGEAHASCMPVSVRDQTVILDDPQLESQVVYVGEAP